MTTVYITLAVAHVLVGLFFSIPVQYGMLRSFWSRQEGELAYSEVAGWRILVVSVLCGPLTGLLSLVCGWQNGVGFAYEWPNRERWVKTTTNTVQITLGGCSAYVLQSEQKQGGSAR